MLGAPGLEKGEQGYSSKGAKETAADIGTRVVTSSPVVEENHNETAPGRHLRRQLAWGGHFSCWESQVRLAGLHRRRGGEKRMSKNAGHGCEEKPPPR